MKMFGITNLSPQITRIYVNNHHSFCPKILERLFIISVYGVCECGCACDMVCVWLSEDKSPPLPS